MPASTSVFTGWKPRVYLWDGGWMGIGRGEGIVPPHAHHAIQVTIALEETIRLRTADGDWSDYRGAAVLPDIAHSFDGCGALGVMFFVDPESREGMWLRNSLSDPISAIPEARLERCLPGLRVFYGEPGGAAETAALVTSVVHSLCAGPPPLRVLDERVVKALRIIRSSDDPRLTLEEVAKKVYLSSSRFAHLFTEEVGVPFRRYVLWRKMTRAMLQVGRGRALSAAAHAGGFSDAAHFTRTFYQMFGIPPSALMGRGEYYEIPAPFELASALPPAPPAP